MWDGIRTTTPHLALSVEQAEQELENHDLLVREQDLAGRGIPDAALPRPRRRSHHPLLPFKAAR